MKQDRPEAPMAWMHKVRLRVLAFMVGVGLAVFGAVSLASLPFWPVFGVAVAAVAVAVNRMTSRLTHPTCWGCGADITGQPPGEYGVMCAACGSLNQDVPGLGRGREGRDTRADA